MATQEELFRASQGPTITADSPNQKRKRSTTPVSTPQRGPGTVPSGGGLSDVLAKRATGSNPSIPGLSTAQNAQLQRDQAIRSDEQAVSELSDIEQVNLNNQGKMDVAGLQGQNTLANTALGNQGRMDVTQQQGLNSLANTELQGQNTLANTGLNNTGKIDQLNLGHTLGLEDMAAEDQYARGADNRSLAADLMLKGVNGQQVDNIYNTAGEQRTDLGAVEVPREPTSPYGFQEVEGELYRTNAQSGEAGVVSPLGDTPGGAAGLSKNFDPSSKNNSPEDLAYLKYLKDNGMYEVLAAIEAKYNTTGR